MQHLYCLLKYQNIRTLKCPFKCQPSVDDALVRDVGCKLQAPSWLTSTLKRLLLKSYWMTLEWETERTERRWTGTRLSQESMPPLSHRRTRLYPSALPEGTLVALPGSCFICCWMQYLHLLCLTVPLPQTARKLSSHCARSRCRSAPCASRWQADLQHCFRISLKLTDENHDFRKKPAENNCFNPTDLISGYGPNGVLSWSSLNSKLFCISSNVVKYCRPLTVGIGTGPLKAETIL